MILKIGSVITVEGERYTVIGKMTCRNTNDNCSWDEYHLKGKNEAWLSIDDTYNEYSISYNTRTAPDSRYHIVDSGSAVVTAALGNIDVDPNEHFYFTEYEDQTEELIYSCEDWDGDKEYSKGHYIEEYDINLISNGENSNSYHSHSRKPVKTLAICSLLAPLLFIITTTFFLLSGNKKHAIQDYVSNNDLNYHYSTSITGEHSQKANVYISQMDISETVTDIITGIDGKTSSIMQNSEDDDNSIAILTNNEYCLIYTSTDGDTLVQVSSRKYAYYTDSDPYHSSSGTSRYYRRYYYTKGYYSDRSSYSGYSPYSSYNDTEVSYDSDSYYNTYSKSIRQSSSNHRTSSGGGLSSGK